MLSIWILGTLENGKLFMSPENSGICYNCVSLIILAEKFNALASWEDCKNSEHKPVAVSCSWFKYLGPDPYI